MFQTKFVENSKNTPRIQYIFSLPENRAACEITWKNMADKDMSQTM
jgi:hypothetical protein